MTMKFKAAAIAAVSGLALAGAAQAATTHLMANLSGAKEKPAAGDTKGSGMAHVTVDTDKNQVCYEVTTENLADPIMAHIHKGAADAAGPVAVPLEKPDAKGHSQGCANVDAAVAKDIADNPGNYYVNVHTAAFKAGAIRGQLGK